MAVFKIEKQKNYTVMSNYHLQDRSLSYKAKGLLSFMLSLPEDWDYSMKGLVAVSKENIKAIRSILNELKDHGYLEIQQTRGEKGYYKYEYIIREIPLDVLQEKNNPDTQKGYADIGDTEKDNQINTNKQNTKEQTVKDVKSNLSFVDLDELNPLTHKLIKNKYIDIEDTDIYYYDSLFEKLIKQHTYKKTIIMTDYILSRISKNKYIDKNGNVIDYEFIDEEGNRIENKFGFFKGAMNNCILKLKNNEELVIDPETGWFVNKNEKEDNYDLDYDLEI